MTKENSFQGGIEKAKSVNKSAGFSAGSRKVVDFVKKFAERHIVFDDVQKSGDTRA